MTDHSISDLINERARLAARELETAGKWRSADEHQLEVLFERAATQALRTPAFAERSRRLRALGRRFVPQSLRPLLRRSLGIVDRFVERSLSALRRGD